MAKDMKTIILWMRTHHFEFSICFSLPYHFTEEVFLHRHITTGPRPLHENNQYFCEFAISEPKCCVD